MGFLRRAQRAGSDEQRPAVGGAAHEHREPDERAPAQQAVARWADRTGPGERFIVALAGIREPIVVVLFLIAFFTAISGKPLDGLLLLIVATGLAWDAAARYRRRAAEGPGAADETGRMAAPGARAPGAGSPGGGAPGTRSPGTTVSGTAALGTTRSACTTVAPGTTASAGALASADTNAAPVVEAAQPPRRAFREALAPGRRRSLILVAGLAAAATYAAVVGSFSRYSWPATVGVVALGTVVVAAGWRGPLRRRPDPGPLPLPGAALWAGLLVAGGLWELASLLQQPDLTTTSYAHPTISALTDPLLGAHTGRSVALAVWLAVGWFLVER